MATKKKTAAAKRPAKNPVGRPKKPITEKQVFELASIGCTNVEIAAVLDCCDDTLVNNFSDAIKKGRETMKKSLRRIQMDLARRGNPTMAIWLGKQYLGQKDRSEVETVTLTEAERVEKAIKGQMEDFKQSREEAINQLAEAGFPGIEKFVLISKEVN
jgi:hypothetical protein